MKFNLLRTAITAATVGTPVHVAAHSAPPEPAVATPIRRMRLWNLEEKHHCPIIGTCLPMDDLLRFAKRFRFDCDLRNEYAMHVEAVARSFERNEFTEAVQKHLDRKFAATLKCFDAGRSDEDVRALWQKRLACGETAPAMWAALTNKYASVATRQIVHADIHMLSHQVGAGKAADVRRLAFLEKENVQQRRDLSTLRLESEQREAALTTISGERIEREMPTDLEDLLRYDEENRFGGQAMLTAVEGKKNNPTPANFTPKAYQLLDLAGWYHFDKQTSLNLAVNNLFDKKYFEWAGGRDVTATYAAIDAYSQPGRNFSLSVKHQF